MHLWKTVDSSYEKSPYQVVPCKRVVYTSTLSWSSRVVSRNFVSDFLDGVLVDGHEALRLTAEVVNVARVDVEPECVNVKVMLLETFFEEAVGCHVLKLLKCVYLR